MFLKNNNKNKHLIMQSTDKLRAVLIGSAILIPILGYFALIRFYGINAPYFDDLQDILEFMVNFHDADQAWEQLSILFKQHNQHRTVFSHIIYLIQYKVFGSLHFVWLMLFANLAAIGIWLSYLFLFRRSDHRIYIAIGTALLVFQPQPYQAMFSAMGSLSSYPVLFFAFLAVIFLQFKSIKTSCLAGIFTLLCIFTNANGILLPITVILMIIFTGLTATSAVSAKADKVKSGIPLIVYFLICSLGLLIFFYNYNSAGVSPFDRLLFQLQNFDWLIKNMLYLIGSGYSYENFTGGILLGAAGTILLIGLVYKKYYLQQPVLMTFLLFLLLSLGAVAVVRGEPEQPVWIISSHYFHLSMHIWAILLIAYIDLYATKLRKKFTFVSPACLALLALLWTASYIYHVPRIVADCLERKEWSYVLHRDLLNGTVMRDYWDGLILTSLQRGYIEANPGKKEFALPFLSDKQSCYFGAW
jgi:hypothetical protein